MKIVILLLYLSIISSKDYFNATEFIEEARKRTPADESILKEAIENTKEYLKHYIFYKVAADPPQPDFDKSYFPKIDFNSLFKDIKTKNTNYFDFSRKFISEVYKLNDLHTQPYFDRIPVGYYSYICPIKLSTRIDNKTNTPKMYGNFIASPDNYILFKNYKKVVDAIQNNLDTPIKTINKKDPFTFIQTFAGIKLRSKHATYVFNQATYTGNNFYIPVGMEDLSNFTVEYENGQKFVTDYIIQNNTKIKNNMKFYKNKEDNEKFLSYLSNNKINLNHLLSNEYNSFLFPFQFKNLDDIILDFEEKYGIKNKNIFLSTINSEEKVNAIEWKYNYISKENPNNIVFQCRIDETNHVNVMKINNFGSPLDSKDSLDVAEKCANLFDENEYRIVIIFPRNGGGNPVVGYNIIELLSPYILTRNTLRIKKDVNMTQFIELYNSFELFEELNSTNKVNGSYFKDGFVNETYGNKIEEFSKPFVWRVNQKKIEEIKKKLKHKRRPDEIVILTDGFALSAASIFMKSAYKSGAGIIIGYNGNPNLPDNIFDISQSPSAVLGVQNYKNIYPEIFEKTARDLIGLASITCIASFHEFQESHIPQEYDVQIPDKRIKIFHPYDDSYYQTFIEESIKVLDYYKENCNPKNKFFVKLSDECKFDNHLHGGFRCGSDSKWNKSDCVPSYCDSGYYYNRIANSCIVYPLDKDNKTWIYIVIGVSAAVVIIIIVVLIIICYKKHYLCFNKAEKSFDPNYNVNDDNLILDENET